MTEREHKSAYYKPQPVRTEETRKLENERNSLKHELDTLKVRYIEWTYIVRIVARLPRRLPSKKKRKKIVKTRHPLK